MSSADASAAMVTLRHRLFALDQSLFDCSASSERLAAVAAGPLLEYIQAINPAIFDTCETLRDAIRSVPHLTKTELMPAVVTSERSVEGQAAVDRIIEACEDKNNEGKKVLWLTIEYEPQWVPVEDFRGDMLPLINHFGHSMPEQVENVVAMRTQTKGTTVIHRYDNGKSFPIDRMSVKHHRRLPNNNIEVYVKWGRYKVPSTDFDSGPILASFNAGREFEISRV